MIWPFTYLTRKHAHRKRLALAAEAWLLLPQDIRDSLLSTPIRVLDKPSAEDQRKHGIPADVSGCFVEDIAPSQDEYEGPAGEITRRMGVICLYLDNIDPRTAEGVAGVLLHEASHMLGLDDCHTEAHGL